MSTLTYPSHLSDTPWGDFQSFGRPCVNKVIEPLTFLTSLSVDEKIPVQMGWRVLPCLALFLQRMVSMALRSIRQTACLLGFVCLTLSIGVFPLPESEQFSKNRLKIEIEYRKGADEFYDALRRGADRLALPDDDRDALLNPRKRLDRLYEHLMNFYLWARNPGESDFIRLGREMGEEFLLSIRDLDEFPRISKMSRLQRILRSTGYHSRKAYPQYRKVFRTLEKKIKGNWAFEAIDLRPAHKRSQGRGVQIAIVDSGIDPTIKEIRGNIKASKNFLDGGYPIGKSASFPFDWGGHGTSVASITHEVAPRADLMIVKVTDDESMRTADLTRWTAYLFAAGIRWAAFNGADIINLSAAFPRDPGGVIREAVRDCRERNVVVVAAMGNAMKGRESRIAAYSPASYDEVIAVGGVEQHHHFLRIWPYSSRGSFVDVVAPAAAIWAESPSYLDTRSFPGLVDGNSIAVPAVAGTAALLLSVLDSELVEELRLKPGGIKETIERILKSTASNAPLGFDLPNPFSGFGLINCRQAVELAASLRSAAK